MWEVIVIVLIVAVIRNIIGYLMAYLRRKEPYEIKKFAETLVFYEGFANILTHFAQVKPEYAIFVTIILDFIKSIKQVIEDCLSA